MSSSFVICPHKEAFFLEGGVIHSSHRHSIIVCDPIDHPHHRGSIVKYGQCFSSLDDAFAFAQTQGRDCSLVGLASNDEGMQIKRSYDCVRRFKTVDVMHTDRDIADHGVELILWGDMIGVVTSYQTIAVYEDIDFGKPFRDMTMGMIPAKLANILISFALRLRHHDEPTVYDPFVGSGTIPLMALSRGYRALGSDIDHITACKRTMQRRSSKHPSSSWSIWHHDASDPSNKSLARFATHIVTEGWLGPIITHRHQQNRIWESAREVGNLITRRVPVMRKNHPDCPLVFCIPRYMSLDHNVLSQWWSQILTPLGVVMTDYVYSRPKQSVGRRVVYCSVSRQ